MSREKGKSTVTERLEWVFGPANADLNHVQKLLLAYIAFRDGEGGCWGTIESLAAATDLGITTTRRAVRVLEGAFELEDHPLVQVPIPTRAPRIRRRGNRWITCREPMLGAAGAAGGGRPERPGGAAGAADYPAGAAGTTFATRPERPPEHLNEMMNGRRPDPDPLGGRVVAQEDTRQGELVLPRVIEGEVDHHQVIAEVRRKLGAS